jgi:hypothetical protein
MDMPNQALIDTLTYLLPGFIAAEIGYNLTPSPRIPCPALLFNNLATAIHRLEPVITPLS